MKKNLNKRNNGKKVMVSASATMVNNIPNNTGIYFDAKNGRFFASNEVVKMFCENVVDKGENFMMMILQNPKLLENLGAVVKTLKKQEEPKKEEA